METTVGSPNSDRLRLASYVVATLALVTAVGAGAVDLRIALLPLAVLLGWSHLHSVWGQSLIGALTPLVKVAHDWTTWGLAVSLYTLTGLLVTLGVGAGIGELGHVAGLPGRPAFVLGACLAIALALAAREVGVLRIRLPERPLQTEKIWVHQFGPLGAATLWGLHLSLGFFTRINYGGFWMLTLLALGLGSPGLGAVLIGGHWLGKALSIWVAPLALGTSADGSEVVGIWDTDAAHYRRVQALGLTGTAAVLATWLTMVVSGGWPHVVWVLLDSGLAGIVAVVAIQTVVLLDVLRRTVRIKTEVYAAMPEVMKYDRLAGGTLVEFEASDPLTGTTVRSSDLRGAPTALLFIAPHMTETPADWLLDTIAGIRHRGEGRLFILCDGSGAACTELSRLAGPDVPVLLDEEGQIRGRFLVSTTPAAVLLDSEARVAQYGMPEHVPDREKEAI